MNNLQDIFQAGFSGRESIETDFEALGLQLRSLERSPSFDLELDLEGQYTQPSKHLSGWILSRGID